MSYNGSGTFNINTAGQPVVAGTTISDSAFNALTADLASGLSNCITKDGQQTVTADIPWGGKKITGLGAGTSSTDAANVGQIASLGPLSLCEFRLTLTTGVPVTTSDVTAATTIYMSPFKGSRIALYDGAATWNVLTSAEISIAVPAVASQVYDVFCFNSGGTATLELLAWTNATTRATALVLQNGVWVKTGATTRRYIGTFRTTAVAGQTEDSLANRFLWNYYNRVVRVCRVRELTNSWNYSTATIRQANGSTANQLNFVIGVSEDPVSASLRAAAFNTAGGALFSAGMALDSTTTFQSQTYIMPIQTATSAANALVFFTADMEIYSGIGKHFISWNEWSQAVANTTWIGDNGDIPVAGAASGMQGRIFG